MTFERPELLALAPLAALLLAFAVGAHWRRLRRLEASYDAESLRRLFPVRLDGFPTARFLYLVGAGLAVGLAAAGPLWLRPEPPEPPPPLDVALAVDLSLSMSARDAIPSRIERAQEAIARITEELPSIRYSLVVFAGWPYTLVLPTDDPDVVRYFSASLEPQVVPEDARGNSLADAIELARGTLEARPRPDARRAVLIVSDGDVYQEATVAARAAADAAAAGTQIWVAGLGSEDGVPLTLDGEPVLDAPGRDVIVRQDRELLRAVADAGQGHYQDITDGEGLSALIGALADLNGHADEEPAEPFDTTALLALLAIPLLLWEGAVDLGRTGRASRQTPSVPDLGPGPSRELA